jgi:hypothetical protein
MKRILFYKPLPVIINAFLLVLTFTSCKKQTTDIAASDASEEIVTATAKGGKPSGPAEVFLKVTVDNTAGYKITNDGGGDYTNGLQSVGAKFDGSGNFIFACGTSGHGPNATLVRWMNINFDSPINVLIPPPITGNDKVTAITTGFVAAFTFIPLQNLSIGQSECVGLTGGSNAGWVMNFHRTAEDVTGSPSSYAVFTRINSTQWTVTPAGSCSPNSNVCALRNGPGVLYGYYNMPFSFTLTKI